MPKKLIPNKTNICEPRKMTPSNEEILCSCPECQRIFFSLKNLKQHIKVHTEGLHECIYCNRQFQRLSHLKHHVRIHTGEKPFACRLCPKSFSILGSLTSHTRIHTGEKPFDCRFCHKSFSQHTQLRTHLGIHTGEKPYNCKICAKTFSDSTNLLVHQRIHNGDKPYKCTFCSKSFSQSGNLQVHMRIHTGERPYNCTICSKSLSRKYRLQTHMRTHSNKMPRAHSMGRKSNVSIMSKQHISGVGKTVGLNLPNGGSQRAKSMHKEGLGHYRERASMRGATTTKLNPAEIQTQYKEQNKQLSSLTCQVCHQVLPSLQDLCRHYSLQHKLPKVVMQKVFIQA